MVNNDNIYALIKLTLIDRYVRSSLTLKLDKHSREIPDFIAWQLHLYHDINQHLQRDLWNTFYFFNLGFYWEIFLSAMLLYKTDSLFSKSL